MKRAVFRRFLPAWHRRTVFAAAGLAALVSSPAVFAGDGAGRAPLDALVAEALLRNPDVLAAEAALDAARERPAQAGALADPMLGIVYTNDGWSPTLGREPMSTLAVMGSQALPYPGKRRLRRDIAEADAQVLAGDLERVRRTVAASVARAYWRLVLARELRGLADEKRTLWRRVEETARARYAGGPGTQLDVVQAQAEAARVEEERVAEDTEARIAVAEINRLLARAPDIPVETPSFDILQEEVRAPAAVPGGSADIPELGAAAAVLERARAAAALARREFKPDFELQTAYMNRGGLPAMWQAGVTVNLPVRRATKRAALAEAEARVRQAEADLQSLNLIARLRTQERQARLDAARRLTALYETTLIPQRRIATESALAGYEAGVGSQVEVLATLDALVSDRAEQLRLVARQAVLRVALAEGALEVDAEDGMRPLAPRMSAPRLVPMRPGPGTAAEMTTEGR